MKGKLIALLVAALMTVGVVAVVAGASPDSKDSSGSNDKNEKHLKARDRSIDKTRGVREGTRSDQRQDRRVGDQSTWDDAGYDDSRHDDGDKDDQAASDSSSAGTSLTTVVQQDDSKDKAEHRDKDRRYKEGTKADRRSDRNRGIHE